MKIKSEVYTTGAWDVEEDLNVMLLTNNETIKGLNPTLESLNIPTERVLTFSKKTISSLFAFSLIIFQQNLLRMLTEIIPNIKSHALMQLSSICMGSTRLIALKATLMVLCIPVLCITRRG